MDAGSDAVHVVFVQFAGAANGTEIDVGVVIFNGGIYRFLLRPDGI